MLKAQKAESAVFRKGGRALGPRPLKLLEAVQVNPVYLWASARLQRLKAQKAEIAGG